MKDEAKAPAVLIGFGAKPVADEEDTGELAGKALKKALDSGKGIKAAFEAMLRECQPQDSEESADEDADEEL